MGAGSFFGEMALLTGEPRNATIVSITETRLFEITKADPDIVPLFLKNAEGDIQIITAFSKDFTDIQEGYKLAYLGKMFPTDTETAKSKEESQ